MEYILPHPYMYNQPLNGLENRFGDKVKIIHNDGSDLEVAQQIAQSVDVVVLMVGYTYKDEGEYIPHISKGLGDRINLGLRENEIKLINAVSKVNQKCVVVLIGGSAILMEEWRTRVPAILMAWYSGMEGGNALADILFGAVNPSGKLPLTIPTDPAHLPFFDIYVDEIEYGYYHGYTLMEKERRESAFPFGFGLSYTEYRYKNIRVESTEEKISVSVEISNIGAITEYTIYIGASSKNEDLLSTKITF